jgi:hypothetical protein
MTTLLDIAAAVFSAPEEPFDLAAIDADPLLCPTLPPCFRGPFPHERRLPDMTIAEELGSLLSLALSPPVYPPGSFAAGSATEERNIARWRETVRQRVLSLRAQDLGQYETMALDTIERIARPMETPAPSSTTGLQ